MAGGKKRDKMMKTPDKSAVKRKKDNLHSDDPGNKSKQKARLDSSSSTQPKIAKRVEKKAKKGKEREKESDVEMENVFDMQMGVSAGNEDMFQEEGELREPAELKDDEEPPELMESTEEEDSDDEKEVVNTGNRVGSVCAKNNNAVKDVEDCDDQSSVIEFNFKWKAPEPCQEELDFMERFATFLEKRDEQKWKKEEEQNPLNVGQRVNVNIRNEAARMDKMDAKKKGSGLKEMVSDSRSEITLYKPVVNLAMGSGQEGTQSILAEQRVNDNSKAGNGKRDSSSSEELGNTSDELGISPNNTIDDLITEARNKVIPVAAGKPIHEEEVRVGPSGYRPHRQDQGYKPEPTPQERAADMVKQVELARARILEVQGKFPMQANLDGGQPDGLGRAGSSCEMVHSVHVDEEYSDLSAHVEENIRRKIAISEYRFFKAHPFR